MSARIGYLPVADFGADRVLMTTRIMTRTEADTYVRQHREWDARNTPSSTAAYRVAELRLVDGAR